MHHRFRPALLLCALACFASGSSYAQGAKPAATPAAESPLGERFVSAAGGISFRAPADAKRIKPSAVGTTIVQYYNAEDRWSLAVQRLIFEKPTKLVTADDPKTLEDESQTKPGILDATARQLQVNNQATQVLRKDVVNVGRNNAGVLITRFTESGQTWLRQQALIEASDRLYYSFDLRTPSTWTPADKEDEEDPTEQVAVEVFNAILDSVQLVDQSNLINDRNERLYRTRALFVTMNTKLRALNPGEHYFRIRQNGKDVGWLFTTEEAGERASEPGYFATALSETTSKEGRKDSMASEMFVSRDRRKESWVTHAVSDNKQAKVYASEFGVTSWRMQKVLDEKEGDADPADEKQPKIRVEERYVLSVTQTGKAGAAPEIKRDLPPYYLPQALGQLLPRLVPLNEPKGYLFASWVTADRELVYRYIDVEREREVEFAGKRQRVVPVRDRIGLEGEPTFHYLTPDGEYLGSENKLEGMTVVRSDAQTLAQLFPDAKIARPRVLDDPKGAAREGN